MMKKEKKWFGITRSPEEDLALVEITRSSPRVTAQRVLAFMLLSLLILACYLLANRLLAPEYPVPLPFAERFESFTDQYPPFRLSEYDNYRTVRALLDGTLGEDSGGDGYGSIGYALLAAPLASRWGESGLYYTNAVIMWLSAIVFFFLMLELAAFPLALAATLVLAFATPNFFFAASAFSEPAAQLVLLVAVLMFVKGMVSQSEMVYFLLCGTASGLLLFFQPWMAAVFVLFFGLIVYERGRFSFHDRSIVFSAVGFAAVFLAYLAVNRLVLSSFFPPRLTPEMCPYLFLNRHLYGAGGNMLAGLWMLMFDSPHGIMFIMPFAMLVPPGLVILWRNEMRPMAILAGLILLVTILAAAASHAPLCGGGLGSRMLLPVVPFLVIPPALLWSEQRGEKVLVIVTLVLTVYMAGFNWWAGTIHGRGVFIGSLHDHAARSIILARKGLLERPGSLSANDLRDLYRESLARGDIESWLMVLDRDILAGIRGYERAVFERMCGEFAEAGGGGRFIESVDPDTGVRPVMTVESLFDGDAPGVVEEGLDE